MTKKEKMRILCEEAKRSMKDTKIVFILSCVLAFGIKIVTYIAGREYDLLSTILGVLIGYCCANIFTIIRRYKDRITSDKTE